MKKLLTFAALCFGMFTVANAQYSPEKGDVAVELGFTPFKAGGETFQLNEGMVKARWFFSDKNALRLKLGLGIDNKTNTIDNSYNPIDKTVPYYVSEETKKVKNKTVDFSFLVGYERHLFTKGRFDVYAGIELGYGMNKASGSETTESSTKRYSATSELLGSSKMDKKRDYTNYSPDGTTSLSYFMGNLFAGVDFYVWKNLYLGAECGFGLKTGKSPNTYYCDDDYSANYDATGVLTSSIKRTFDGETNTTTTVTSTPSNTSTNTTNGPKTSNETSETSFKLFVEPAVRIGWKF